MRMGHCLALASVVAASGVAWSAESVSVSLVGLRIANGQNQSRSSAPATIDPANNYTVTFNNALARGTSGLLAVLFPQPTPIGDILQTFDPDAEWVDTAEVPNEGGAHPFLLGERTGSGTSGGVTGSLTLRSEIFANDVFTFSITNVTLSPAFLVGAMEFTSGTVTVTRNPITCNDIDFNSDGLFPDDLDLVDFLRVFAGGACSTGSCDSIDFNNDGLFPDDADVAAFLSVLAGGPC